MGDVGPVRPLSPASKKFDAEALRESLEDVDVQGLLQKLAGEQGPPRAETQVVLELLSKKSKDELQAAKDALAADPAGFLNMQGPAAADAATRLLAKFVAPNGWAAAKRTAKQRPPELQQAQLEQLAKRAGEKEFLPDSVEAKLVEKEYLQCITPEERQQLTTARQPPAPSEREALENSPNFKALDAATQQRVREVLSRNAGNPRVLRAIAGLLGSEGFSRLDAADRKKALGTLLRNPADPAFARDVRALVDSPALAQATPAVRTQLMETLGALSKDAPGRRAILELVRQAGFGKLSAAEQGRLLNYLGGTNPEISAPARALFLRTVGPQGVGQSPERQAAELRKFIAEQSSAEEVLSPPRGTFTRKHAEYQVHRPPEEVKDYPFPSGKAAALKYDVEVNGRHVAVYMPKTPGSPKDNYHSIEQVAKGLASIPPQSLALVTKVSVDPKRNPEDAHWAKEYHDPHFSSYMTCGADGAVTIYPTDVAQKQEDLDGALIHETGHALSMSRWGNSATDKRWDAWKKAIISDGISASKYAKNSPDEDFAETLKMYFIVKGTPQEAEMRRLMPERFRLIDALLAEKKP